MLDCETMGNPNSQYFSITRRDTLHDQMTAFDELRKTVAIECKQCDGWGFTEEDVSILDTPYIRLYDLECDKCHGDSVLCAYCEGHSKSCECGTELS